jgi:hypothetical protein
VARFLPDDGTGVNTIAVLSSQTAGGLIELFQPVPSSDPLEPDTYEVTSTILSTLSLKNFRDGGEQRWLRHRRARWVH